MGWSWIVRNGLLLVVGGIAWLVVGFRWRAAARPVRVGIATVGGLAAVAGVILVSYGQWVAGGDHEIRQERLASGVDYERLHLDGAVVHLITLDLDDPCVSLAASPVAPDGTARATKTATWARDASMLVAMNANFFFPYDEDPFWDVYPAEGEEVTVLGPVVSSPVDRTSGAVEWRGDSVWLDAGGGVGITTGMPRFAIWGVTGRSRVLAGGRDVSPPSEPYPRSIIALGAEQQTMWWLVADGKQPGYSDGLTLSAAAVLLAERGATDAVELDGGGSSTLVATTGPGGEGLRRLSRPMQIRVPGRSRVVANHIGVPVPSKPNCQGPGLGQ